MNKKTLISISLLAGFTFFSFPVIEAKELTLKAGQLPGEMAGVIASDDTALILKGTASPYDLTSLRSLPNHVTSLDMSELTIIEGRATEGEWFGKSEFADGELPAYMLLGTNVASVKLPQSVSVIGQGAFSGTPLKEFNATGVKKVGEGVFYNCKALKKVDFQDAGFTELPARFFSGCVALADIHIPHRITTVGAHAFENCRVTALSFPDLMEIGDYAFAYASSLREIRFAKGCKMGEGVFYGAGALESLPNDPGSIPDLFSTSGNNMEILAVKVPEVGEAAFSGASANIISFSSDVRSIGRYAFHSMPNLKKVIVEGCTDIPEADSEAFAGNDVSEIMLHVGRGQRARWGEAPVWKDFNITEEESGVSESAIPGADGREVEIRKQGDRIMIASGVPLNEVAVYSVGGETLSLTSPESCSFEMAYPEGEEVIIVKASAGREVNVVKLSK